MGVDFIDVVIPTLIAISIISFVIIQAPPGDYLDTYVAGLQAMGQTIDPAEIASLKIRYGLDQPVYVQYSKWMWSLAKFVDLLKHLWMPAIVIGTAGTCGLIRVMRANLLDELQKPYVMVARAKGLTERKLLYKYPFRIAINPVVSTIGWTLPGLVSGEVIVSLVLGLPTIGPLFFQSLMSQDMFLAGSIIFILSFLTVIGTLISDILLVWVDPRIKESIQLISRRE